MLTALEFLEAHMNDNDDMHVIPVIDLDGKHFMRVKSGHRVEIGWNSHFNIGRTPDKPARMTTQDYLKSLNLQIRWLPQVSNQGLREQLQNCNVYYRVDGLDQLPGWDSTPRFFCSRSGFFPENSTIQREYCRLKEMEECGRQIALGTSARIKLRKLKHIGQIHDHPNVKV